MIACILLAWLKLLALDGDLARAEPSTLRYRVLHAAARLVRCGRRRILRIAVTWPWAEEIVTACSASRQSRTQPDQRKNQSRRARKKPRGPRNPPVRQPGHRHTQPQELTSKKPPASPPAAAVNSCEKSGLATL